MALFPRKNDMDLPEFYLDEQVAPYLRDDPSEQVGLVDLRDDPAGPGAQVDSPAFPDAQGAQAFQYSERRQSRATMLVAGVGDQDVGVSQALVWPTQSPWSPPLLTPASHEPASKVSVVCSAGELVSAQDFPSVSRV